MMGIKMNGFCLWTINRDADGPFKCYKYMQGANCNENIKALCESIVRSTIANTKLSQVLTER